MTQPSEPTFWLCEKGGGGERTSTSFVERTGKGSVEMYIFFRVLRAFVVNWERRGKGSLSTRPKEGGSYGLS